MANAFIDRVDQGLVGVPREAWIHFRAGLIEAARDVMSSNTHVRIFDTVREEADVIHGRDTEQAHP